MRFEELLEQVGSEPVFETSFLLAGDADPLDIRKQLSRWTKKGQLYQLRKGLYALAPPYQKVKAHPFLIANRLVAASYISLESALSFYGLIPESVPVVMSVTTGRPHLFSTDMGDYRYHHLKKDFFRAYHRLELPDAQHAFIASPEKALLDLIHLRDGADDPSFLKGLRLQNLEGLNHAELMQLSQGKPKLQRAARAVSELIRWQEEEYETL